MRTIWILTFHFVVASLVSKPGVASALSLHEPILLVGERLTFRYQENNEPWDQLACAHNKVETSPYGWTVSCSSDRKVYTYYVHLAVSYYPRTQYGQGAYEVLYWITDRSDEAARAFHAVTLWVHNSRDDNRAQVFELAQGVENDQSSLRLTIDLR